MPPRRTKRRIKIAPVEPLASTTATETTNDVAISQQKRPPPPPPPEKCRRNNSGYLENRQPQCDTAANCPRVEDKQHHRESRIIDTAEIEAKPHDNTTSAGDNSSASNGDPIPKSIVSKPSFLTSLASSKRKAFDKYPSLFFTLHDFENVVFDTWNRNDSVDPEDPQDLREEEPLKAHTLDDSEVCFRVTTTNLPFEKCLNRWRDPFDDGDFVRKFDDCRFDDKKNENDRTNGKRSSGYDVSDNNGDSKCRASTKVRFLIESPNYSLSKPDANVKIGVPCDSLRSSILNDEQAGEQRSAASSMKLNEIREEFAKDCCDNTRNKSYTSSVEKGNSMMGEDDPFISAGANEVDEKLKTPPQPYCDRRNNDVNCEKICKKGSDLISWYAQTGNEILETGKENIITLVTRKTIASEQYDAKRVNETDTSSEIAENVRGLTDESLKTACGIEEAAKISQRRTYREGKMFLKKPSNEKNVAKNEKVFFESPQNCLNVCNDESNKNISTDDFIKSVQIEQTRRFSEENKGRGDSFVNSKNNREIVSSSKDIFVKNIPVEVRRNSFLETMLSDELTDISMNCAVISTTISTSIDKELNNPNRSSDKILELKTDMTESEYLRDFYNGTEIDTKNQKVLKHSKKMKEKISGVKSTQLVNKSASDVKNDVLNELLCNFNTIKLKIVSPENKKSVTKIEDENISRATAIDNRISKGKENASKFEKSRNDSVPLNTKTDVGNDTIMVEENIKEDLTKIKIEEKSQELKNDTLAISEKIAKNKNIEIEKPNESFSGIRNKIIQDNKSKIKKNSSGIKSKEINVKMNGERTSEETKDIIKAEQEPKKSRDIRIPRTILKKTSVECERQQTNEFQKRIPIGAPMTMNKIFDSKEFKEIADATRKDNPESGKCKEASRETRGKEKTDEVIAGDEADDDRRRIANRSALALIEDTMNSGDNCAIARKTISVNPCNNTDNNRAVTPVVNVSNDQPFRDVVTITPGKVRSFVKYYEIRGDAMIVKRHSKINDREKVARRKFTKSQAVPVAARNSQRPDVITKEIRGEDRSVKSNDCDLPRTSSNKIQSSTFVPRVPEEPLNNPVCKTTETESKTKECEKSGLHMSDKETRASSKSGAKKSVQFLGNFTIINSEIYGTNEFAETVADRDTNTAKKRRPPSRDCDDYQKRVCEIAKSEKPSNVKKDSLQSREDVTQIHAAADHTQNSGINRFVLKPETPQLVFYCTI